ncbi:MAG TPA: glycine zipper domain-containing protein [Chromatiaceae bacterium]|jgi:uncharacterized protein YcfJ|nr:glycine zipper domain-containing protein [Chromatiaceae bacterium]
MNTATHHPRKTGLPLVLSAAVLSATALLAGCGTTTGERTASGAIIGGATGAAIGSTGGRTAEGALIGAGVGALGGYLYDQDQRQRYYDRYDNRYGDGYRDPYHDRYNNRYPYGYGTDQRYPYGSGYGYPSYDLHSF